MRLLQISLVAFAFCALATAIYLYQKGMTTESWPITPGKLVVAEPMEFGSGTGRRGSVRKDFVEYTYTIGKMGYVSNSISVFDTIYNFGGRSETADLDKGKLTVHYDPETPSHAVLIAGPPYRAIETLGFIFLSLVFLSLSLKKIVLFLTNAY